MMAHLPERLALARTRGIIDRIDDSLLLLLAARRRMVSVVSTLKTRADVPPRDLAREHKVRQRAQRLAARIDLPGTTAQELMNLIIGDGCRQQGLPFDRDQGVATAPGPTMPAMMPITSADPSLVPRLLRLLPPPQRLAPLLRMLPPRWQHRLIKTAMTPVLAAPARDGSLDFMRDRRIAIEVEDLRLRWVVELRGNQCCVTDGEADASVRGSVTDLLLLAGRLEDADTLFFQRRLRVTGDTELGLTARNMLDRMPWESIPLALRIVMNRGARFARAARAAHHGEAA
jgi:predicted lipid carrier protein YhbT/chorismate mutase